MLRIVEKLIPISMIVILTSCGNLDTLTDADDVEAEAVQVEEAEAETEAGTEAPGDGAQPITSSIALYGPVDGANDVSPTIDIFVTFSEAMDEDSVESEFSLSDSDGSSVEGVFRWSGYTMTFTPTDNLSNDTTYSVSVGEEAMNEAGDSTLEDAHDSDFTTGSAPVEEPLITNLLYTLADVSTDDQWTISGSGGLNIVSNVINGNRTVTRSDLDINNNNFLIEAVVSSQKPSNAGEAGARIYARIYDDELTVPNQRREVQVRFMKLANNDDNFIGLYNPDGNPIKDAEDNNARIVIRWDTSSPRFRVRLMRVGNNIRLEVEPSDVWDNDSSSSSVTVPITNVGIIMTAPVSFIGFGNALVSGNMASTWESIHITVCSDDTTALPYWPPVPPTPGLLFDDQGEGSVQNIELSAYFSGRAHLATDTAISELVVGDLTLAGDEGTALGDEYWKFNELDADQIVSGSVTVTDISGRSRTSTSRSLTIPVR